MQHVCFFIMFSHVIIIRDYTRTVLYQIFHCSSIGITGAVDSFIGSSVEKMRLELKVHGLYTCVHMYAHTSQTNNICIMHKCTYA